MSAQQWTTARDETLAKWRGIQAGLGQPDPFELITEINAVCSLCEKAKEEAHLHGTWWPCRYCVAYHQFGGCSDLRARLTEVLAARDWETAKALVADAVANLEALNLGEEKSTETRPSPSDVA